ncbi:protein SHQ1 homolog [Notothenia coriiceps]|uniref:Protein SHQ1 homolog n=1 Tax=Notothenia coriiceps TaxID=8208 RepID=A0A6I9MWJ8_9TELE|nr:PREDICTED: protein SHQ1 homolog [Notothenia coriiceps]
MVLDGQTSMAVKSGIIKNRKTGVLKCLLDIHKVFRENDPAYILNDLYITDYCTWIQRVKSKKMSALAATLQKASLQKKDLELELEELEEAAKMVAEEESHSDSSSSSSDSSSSSSSSSSSDSSDESEESEGEGEGGEMSKDNPPQSQHTPAASPLPQQSTLLSAEDKVNALPSASEGSRQLIQELGERVTEELNISEDSTAEERTSSRANDGGATKTEATSARNSSSGILLEPSPRRNPLLIVHAQEDLTEGLSARVT